MDADFDFTPVWNSNLQGLHRVDVGGAVFTAKMLHASSRENDKPLTGALDGAAGELVLLKTQRCKPAVCQSDVTHALRAGASAIAGGI